MAKQITLNCDFISGASNIKSLPDELVPEIAFAGRSNVGKSSLINLLVHSKKAARVSSKPGCTRQINFYSMYNNKFRFVDLPGYGYSYAGKEEIAQYLSLIEYYLTQRRNLKRVFVLIDGRIGLKEIDKDFICWLTYNNINFNVVLTKADKVNQKNLNAVQESMEKWIHDKGILDHQINTVSILIRCELKNLRNEIFKFIQ